MSERIAIRIQFRARIRGDLHRGSAAAALASAPFGSSVGVRVDRAENGCDTARTMMMFAVFLA
jgi:hypothetical protein